MDRGSKVTQTEKRGGGGGAKLEKRQGLREELEVIWKGNLKVNMKGSSKSFQKQRLRSENYCWGAAKCFVDAWKSQAEVDENTHTGYQPPIWVSEGAFENKCAHTLIISLNSGFSHPLFSCPALPYTAYEPTVM